MQNEGADVFHSGEEGLWLQLRKQGKIDKMVPSHASSCVFWGCAVSPSGCTLTSPYIRYPRNFPFYFELCHVPVSKNQTPSCSSYWSKGWGCILVTPVGKDENLIVFGSLYFCFHKDFIVLCSGHWNEVESLLRSYRIPLCVFLV